MLLAPKMLAVAATSKAQRMGDMARLIIANRRGHQVLEWDPAADTEELQETIAEAERIIREAREHGCRVSRKVGGRHELYDGPFDPRAEEYQIIAPIAGG